MQLIRLVFPIPLPRFFDYWLEDNQHAVIGARVLVPFGNQTKVGIVVDFPSHSEIKTDKLKTVLRILDQHSLFDSTQWRLLQWASHYYHAPLGEVLFSALPIKLRQGEVASIRAMPYFQVSEAGRYAIQHQSLQKAKKQAMLLAELVTLGESFAKPTACSPAAWKGLVDKGYIVPAPKAETALSWQAQLAQRPICAQPHLRLNAQQSLVMGKILQPSARRPFLLDGVTGSGKTEIYLQSIAAILAQGKQALVLVPEIGLTPQMIQRFTARFNVAIDILHSNLTETARLNVWLRAKNGESAIVIGTRSALFTPFAQLGIIILDEEHDAAFKQQEGWRYHARDLAILRAHYLSIPIILGSATPSFESLHNVNIGKYEALQLSQRAGEAQSVTSLCIDLKTQRMTGGIAEQLLTMLKTELAQGNQVMLFLNRRGFAPVLICHECGWISMCRACDKPYTYHQTPAILRCHHCQRQQNVPLQCGHCGSTHLVTTGIGTEQLAQTLSAHFPQYGISRIDRDSTARKGALDQHLNAITQGKSQILIGTQMLAKGHHFPNVTLVAIINVDSSLFAQDFRAEERLAQLYIQVAGRAGRANKAGKVVLQTHYPDHPLIQTLSTQSYAHFAQQALSLRQQMQLPPFVAQALFRASGKDEQQVEATLTQLANYFQQIIVDYQWQHFQLLGAMPAPLAKKAGHYRWLLWIQHPSRAKLQQLLSCFDRDRAQLGLSAAIRLSLDIDPIDFN